MNSVGQNGGFYAEFMLKYEILLILLKKCFVPEVLFHAEYSRTHFMH